MTSSLEGIDKMTQFNGMEGIGPIFNHLNLTGSV